MKTKAKLAKPAMKVTTKAAKPAPAAKRTPAAKRAPAAKPSKPEPAVKSAKPEPAAKQYGQRADFGKPVDIAIAKAAPPQRAILEALREMIVAAAPDAAGSVKWGMPTFSIGSAMMCAIRPHKAHVSLILAGVSGTYADPDGLLDGEGSTGRHLKIESLAALPRAQIATWLVTAASRARAS